MLMDVRILIAAVLATSCAVALAAPDEAGGSARAGTSSLDKNGDGSISREEAAAHPRLGESFDRLDTNKDGALSADELRAARRAGHHGRHAHLDTNKDGTITRDEAKSAPHLAENFDAIDTNKDGTLTRDEMSAWRQAHPRGSHSAPVKP
jgi:Ca2+-binding EF-hand superfamily protein